MDQSYPNKVKKKVKEGAWRISENRRCEDESRVKSDTIAGWESQGMWTASRS